MLKKPNAPSAPGVYAFRRGNVPIYIGKAANLKQRLASYFRRPNGSSKIERMLHEATRLNWIQATSDIDALLKEAELIKRHRPKYNVLMRDDKNYFYVGVTKEPFPKIFVTHQPQKSGHEIAKNELPARFLGPYTDGTALYAVLRLLRRIFPYCTCHRLHRRACLASQIGTCPGICCLKPDQLSPSVLQKHRRIYREQIRHVIAVLSGERSRLLATLKRNMRKASRREHYERAARLRDDISGVEAIAAHRTVLRAPDPASHWSETAISLRKLLRTPFPISRIEGYDIANIGREAATGSMVVFSHGVPDKSQYRIFRIKTVTGISDVAMHQEVLRRRFNHPEWPTPQLIVIDGGKAQLNAARSIIAALRKHAPDLNAMMITALAKREETLFTERGKAILLPRDAPLLLHLFQRLRDESHRFARAYHHRLRSRAYAEAR